MNCNNKQRFNVNQNNDKFITDRELHFSKLHNAIVKLVYEIWINPEFI